MIVIVYIIIDPSKLAGYKLLVCKIIKSIIQVFKYKKKIIGNNFFFFDFIIIYKSQHLYKTFIQYI